MQFGLASLLAAGLGVVALAWSSSDLEPKRASFASVFDAPDNYQSEPPMAGSYALNRIKSAPDGNVLDISGNSHKLSDLMDGKYTLVSFV